MKKRYKKTLTFFLVTVILMGISSVTVFAAPGDDLFTVAENIIRDVYNHIAGISTVLAALMSAIAVLGAKLSNNQQKTDQAWDWRATRS